MLLLPSPVLAAEALGSSFIPGSDSAFFPAWKIRVSPPPRRLSAKATLRLETPAAHWALPFFQKPLNRTKGLERK